MLFYLLIRSADELGINFWLRFLALGLAVSLFMLAFYYFSVINRDLPVVQTAQAKSEEAERGRTDAILMTKIRSAMAQTKRLYGLSIAVKNRDGVITLSGEAPTEIDRDFAGSVAKEMPGVRAVNNEIQVVTSVKSLREETAPVAVSAPVEDLELEANLREALAAIPDLQQQAIQIKVHQRAVTLSGRVATEAQRQRAEQLLRNAPKVASVNNQLRLEN